MKIALIQQHATASKTENLKKGLLAAGRAADEGANVICFAELAFEIFHPQVPKSGDLNEISEPIPGPITTAFQEFAQNRKVVVILNLFESAGEQTFDSSPVIGTHGELLGITRMIHITDYPCFHEQDYYYPGDTGAPVYETEFGRLGVAICYDRHFPEYMRALATGGADIVFVPQAGAVGEWPDGLFEAEMRVAAFQNGYFTALCNRVGEESHLTFAGQSFVCNPNGEVIARAEKGADETLFCDIDIDQVAKSHARRLFLRDRRPNLYADWIQ